MIEIKPNIQHHSICPYCQAALKPLTVKWHGMYSYVESQCVSCATELIESLKISHLIDKYFQIDQKENNFWWKGTAIDHAKILLESLRHPETEQLEICKEQIAALENARVVFENQMQSIFSKYKNAFKNL